MLTTVDDSVRVEAIGPDVGDTDTAAEGRGWTVIVWGVEYTVKSAFDAAIRI